MRAVRRGAVEHVLWLAALAACLSTTACHGRSETHPGDDAGHASSPAAGTATPSSAERRELDVRGDLVMLLRTRGASTGPILSQLAYVPLRVTVATLQGGKLRVASRWAGHQAVDFPSYRRSGSYPRAVVRVDDIADRLQPGADDLTWGADFRLDDTSSGRKEDNGDNILQRGTSGSEALFKAEVDGRRAACALHSDKGALVIRSGPLVHTRWWYRLRCLRVGDTLMVVVTEYRPNGIERSYARERAGDIGRLEFEHRVPVAVGGKLARDGSVIASATDQFNGEIADPVIALGH